MSKDNEDNNYNKRIEEIYNCLCQCNEKISHLQDDLAKRKNEADNRFYELYYADLLHDTILNSTWLKDKSFSLHRWAANYSFIYMLYRILDNAKPKHILEMGMGQTSRLTSQYVSYCNPDATLDIIENDAGWIEVYKPQLTQSEHIKVHQCDLEFFKDDECDCRKYKELNKVVGNTKYDLVIIDGPLGADQTLPRSNILDLIKNGNIADDFIIIFDDAERKGEQKTIANTIALLEEQEIKYSSFQRNALKTQQFISSLTKSFIKYL